MGISSGRVRRTRGGLPAAFVEIAKELAAEDDLDRLISLIGERVCRLMGTDSACLSIVEGDELVFRGAYGFDEALRATQRRKIAESHVGRVVLTRQPHTSADMTTDPHWRESLLVTRFGYRAILEAPVILRGEVIGVLAALHKAPRTFSADDVVLLAALADHTAVAFIRTTLARETEARLREAQTLLAVSQAVGATLDLTETLRRVVRETVRALGADTGGAYVAEPDGSALRPVAGYHVPEPLLEAFRQSPIPLRGHRLLEEAWGSRRPVWSSDAPTDPRLDRETWQRLPYRSILFVPMEAKGEPIGGLLVIWWAEAHPITPEELRLVEGISRQAALAIENAQLYEEAERRRREAEVLAELARAITASLDLDTVLERVAKGARELCGSDIAQIALLDPRSGVMRIRHLAGARYGGYESVRIEPGKGIGGQVLLTGQPFRTANYAEDPRISKDYMEVVREEGVVADLAVPIRIGDRVEGVLFVAARSPRPFTDRDEAILVRLADHAAIAIQNARLFGESERRRQTAEGLAELGRLISQSLDPAEVKQRIADSARALFGALATMLSWLEPSGALRVVAVSGEAGPAFHPGLVFPAGTGCPGLAQRERRPVVTPDVLADPGITLTPELRAAIEPALFRAVVTVPLLVRDEAVGTLCIADRAGRTFHAEEVRLAQAVADQAALALENAWLFEETRRQHREVVALGEVAREITSSLERGEVLQRIVDRARELSGADLAFLAPYDPETDTAPIVAASGARTEILRTVTIRRGRGTGGKVLETGEPFHTEDYLRDPRFSKDYAEAATQEGFVAQAVVPLRSGGAITGLLWVVNRTPRRFTPGDLALLSKFADQAAIALENSRLYGELRAALKAVEASQQRIVQTERLRALGEMAGGIAHDFNNALAAILGRTQLLLARTQDPDLRRQLQVIERVALEAGQTVRRIQEFTRMRRLRPFQPVDLARVVEETVEFTRARWADEAQVKGITYEVRVEAAPLPPAAGDPDELREAVTNLVLNALDAMPQGGRVTIRTGVEGERVYCVVTDTGIGMSEEVRRRVFDPFFTTKGSRGTGLGLSMVYGIITRHGGEVEVRSQPGQGSAFTLWLPAAREAAPAPERPAEPVTRPPRSARVLVIDDEEEVREVLVELLRGKGHTVVGCADGRSGLARFEAERFDLVITDLGMPGLSGWEVAQAIKRLRRGTPVALVTGWGDRIDAEEARAKGVDHLVAKPFRIEEIAALVARAISPAFPSGV